jgi:dihydrofolate reductase
MQAPGGPDEDRDGGFEHGGWLVPYFDEKLVQVMTGWTSRAGGFLLGRRTYEIFADSWPRVTDPEDRIAAVLNTRPKYVASRTLTSADWHNSTIIRDVPAEVAKLRQQDGLEIQVHGSGDLLQTLLRHDLVDELRLWFFPVVVAGGKRLFGEGALPLSFTLTASEFTTTGAVLHVYERAGTLTYGTVDIDESGKEYVQLG